MRIEISLDDDEWEKAKVIFAQIMNMKKPMADSHSISDRASFELKGPDGEVKQREEGKSHAAG